MLNLRIYLGEFGTRIEQVIVKGLLGASIINDDRCWVMPSVERKR